MPSDSFYEREKIDPKSKQPWVYTLTDGKPFAFAGLWDASRNPDTADWLQSFAVVTTTLNELTAEVHDRMPVVLHPRGSGRWVERGNVEQPPIDLLRPFEAEAMHAAKAHPKVGNVRNNGPEMLQGPDDEGEPLAVLNSK